MPVTVKNVVVWRKEVAHEPGQLARTLQPLAEAGADLHVVMGYAEGERGIVELCSIAGKRATDAARQAGLVPSPKPTLLVEGDNRPGLGFEIANAVAERGVSISFIVAQVVGDRYSAILGFHDEDDAKKAATAIKKAAR